MKKFLWLLLVAVFSLTFVFAGCNSDGNLDELIVYNWADYIYDYEDDFVEYYRELTGKNIKVTYVTFDTNETMLTKIMKGDSTVDVMCPSEYAIQKLLEQDKLLPVNYFADDVSDYIDTSNFVAAYTHNAANIDSHFIGKQFGEYTGKVNEVFSEVTITSADGSKRSVNMCDYFVPYMYGTLGVLYSKKAFRDIGIFNDDPEHNREVMNKANWGLLFNDNGEGQILSEGLTNRIYMKDSIRDSYAATVFYLLESGKLDDKTVSDEKSVNYGKKYTELPIGDLINTVDDQLIDLCSEALKKQKTQLYGYEVDFGKNELLQEIAYVDLAWSGDALYAVEESWDDDFVDPTTGEKGGYTLGYYVPHTSGNIWFDGWVIPKTCASSHLQAAKIFINFLNQPHVAASNMLEIGYSSAVDPSVIRNDEESQKILMEGYEGDREFADWAEYASYFFDYCDAIDDSNWRYPFVIADPNGNRALSTLGVMRDFGENNHKVSAMWEEVRSTGITAWALLGWIVLAFAVALGIVILMIFLQRRKKMRVVIKRAGDTDTEQSD